MRSSDDLLQPAKANAAQAALHAIASETGNEPIGLETSSNAELKMKAIAKRDTVALRSRPVDFRWESSMATSSVVLTG